MARRCFHDQHIQDVAKIQMKTTSETPTSGRRLMDTMAALAYVHLGLVSVRSSVVWNPQWVLNDLRVRTLVRSPPPYFGEKNSRVSLAVTACIFVCTVVVDFLFAKRRYPVGSKLRPHAKCVFASSVCFRETNAYSYIPANNVPALRHSDAMPLSPHDESRIVPKIRMTNGFSHCRL